MPDSFFDLISVRSFSSLWYWLIVAVYWARTMQMPLDIPSDLIRAARRDDAARARRDVLALAGINARRRQEAAAALGVWRAGLWGFALSVLAVLGMGYRIELAQALLLIAAPSAAVAYLSGRTAARIAAGAAGGQTVDPVRLLARLRARIQWIATAAVFLTAVWGSYYNLLRHALL